MPEGVKLEPLGFNTKVYTSKNHKFSTDSILLADFAQPKGADKACDLGTGCGIIPMLWCRKAAPQAVLGVDILPEAVELCQMSIKENALENRFSAVLGDLRHTTEFADSSSFNLVTMNPPYKPLGRGIMSPGNADKYIRHETACNLADISKAAARLLVPLGRFCLCHRPERLSEVLVELTKAGLEPKKLRLVQSTVKQAPFLFLLEARKGGGKGMAVLPALILHDGGALTAEAASIYGEYGNIYESGNTK